MSLLRKGLDFSTALCNIKLWGQKLGRPCPVPKLSDLGHPASKEVALSFPLSGHPGGAG